MRIIVCGSRDWNEYNEIYAFLRQFRGFGAGPTTVRPPVVIIHGDARGADRLAGAAAKRLGMQVEVHPADWTGRGRAAGHERNRLMLALGADLVVAFKHDFNPRMDRGGTENMVRIAMEGGIRTIVLPIDTRELAVAGG